ncbi:Rho GTPase-activating protein [Echinococcus granulosus]|uniref:Rho GTPase-activating protein n=1 Tax=Echinococcus granulosus TaxID=6210 RepID=W6UNQ9_ECHGR|nr:Rho GTPase-activating protein [Echinococcus granulosus]EUB63300.1 Rho GTPase-activating protein [Echinococcus granulosus]
MSSSQGIQAIRWSQLLEMHEGAWPTDEQDTVMAYADRLAATTAAVDYVNLYRNQKPQQFIDLCKFHLSLLVELPADFNNYNPRACTGTEFTGDATCKHKKNRPWTRLASSMGQMHKSDESTNGKCTLAEFCTSLVLLPIVISVSALNLDLSGSARTRRINAIYENIMKLMDHLSTDENLKMEMIFRKSGNIVRQRELRRRILSGVKVSFPVSFVNTSDCAPSSSSSSSSGFPWSRKSCRRSIKVKAEASEAKPGTFDELKGHDYANTLKNVLREMRNPILTRELLPIFVSVSKITSGHVNDEGVQVPLSPADFQVAQAKQLMAVRILRFLLPERNQRLLRRLLDLLTETVSYAQLNGMSAESLGTIFGPLLLAPTCSPNPDLHKHYDTLNSLTTLMINQGSEGVFGIPEALVDDMDRNLASNGLLGGRSPSKDSGLDTCSMTSSGHEEDARDALYTGLMFAKSSESQGGIQSDLCDVGLTITECAVAELCATVQALPDSDPRKARLVQRINNSNGGLTPQVRKRLRDVLLVSPSSMHRTSFRRLETPSNAVLSGALAKRQTSRAPVVEVNGGLGGEISTTYSSSSLGVGNVGSLCCPLFGILSSTIRSVNQQPKQPHREQNWHKKPAAIGSPIFGDMGAPIAENIYPNSGIRAADGTSRWCNPVVGGFKKNAFLSTHSQAMDFI